MAEQDIPKDEWEAFCESFGLEHQGWVVSVEERDTNGVPTDVEHNVVLDNITVVSGDGKESGIFITVSRETDFRRVHRVAEPTTVRLQQAGGGVHDALTIESSDGRLTELHLRPGPLPDRLKVFTTE